MLCILIGAVSLGLAVVAARDRTGTFSLAPLLNDRVFLLLLFTVRLLRLYLATTAPYIHDEENASIPLSRNISLMPGNLQLPIRGENHPALPAYFVKVSGTLFGTARLGYRSVHILAGLSTITFFLARRWYGPIAARWTAALLAFNEYYLAVSSRATAHAPHLLFLTAAIHSFGRFLPTERPVSRAPSFFS